MTTPRPTRILALALTGAALLLAGCGGDDDGNDATAGATAAETAATATTPAEDAFSAIRNPYSRPDMPAHPDASVDTLIVRDVRVGDGEEVQAGDTIVADYYGTIYQTGRRFDSSWDRGREPIEITIDQGGVIPGWWQGLQGMRVGGRRTLVIPPELGYGDQEQATIPAGSTLFFTVDLLGVRKAEAPGASADQPMGG